MQQFARSIAWDVGRSVAASLSGWGKSYPADLALFWSSDKPLESLKGVDPTFTDVPTLSSGGVTPGDGPIWSADPAIWREGDDIYMRWTATIGSEAVMSDVQIIGPFYACYGGMKIVNSGVETSVACSWSVGSIVTAVINYVDGEMRVGVDGTTSAAPYPADLKLYYDANIEPYTELIGQSHAFNHAVLAPQYQLNADGSYTDVGAKPAVDVFDGKKWLRSCGAVTNMLPGDTSQARSVLLDAQTYALQVFGAGSASCSYGTASVGSPLTFTAASGSTTFTPSGATIWMLTATSYPVPYVPPGVTQPASNATTTNGCWLALPDGSPVWQALTGQPLTLATRVRMGAGSGDFVSNAKANIIAQRGELTDVSYCGDWAGTKVPNAAYDRTTLRTPAPTPWDRNSIIRRVTQVNAAGTQFRVGYMIEGTHTAIQWGSWAAYDGSFNPSTLYRLMLGYDNPYPMWFSRIAIWNKQMPDSDIMKALDGAI